jgi:hypothetical protein
MRKFSWTPSIVPRGDDQDVYLVVDDYGRLGRVWCEADVETTDLKTVVADLLDGQYKNPIVILSFNPAEGWSRDVSEDVAQELRRRCDIEGRPLPRQHCGFRGAPRGPRREAIDPAAGPPMRQHPKLLLNKGRSSTCLPPKTHWTRS